MKIFVCIIKLKNDNVFGEEILGSPRKDIGGKFDTLRINFNRIAYELL